MNRFYMILLAPLVLASSAFATSTTCPTSLTAYLAPSFSCMTNGLTFSNWSYTDLNVPAANVSVVPQTVLGDEGFQFQSAWNVNNTNGGGELREDSLISFTASGSGITNLELFFNGSVTGTGSASVTEQYCLNGTLTNCPVPLGQISVTNPPPGFSDQVFFAPVQSISVSKDILVDTGSGVGSAMISQVVNNFSSPEPLSFVLLGSGLLGLGLLRKRIKR
jgi:hypothetical protein